MNPLMRPADEHALAEIVGEAAALGRPLELLGSGSRRSLGRPVTAETVVDLTAFSGIIDYVPGELVLTAFAGTPLAAIDAVLAENGQHLACEPLASQSLLGLPPTAAGTLGGLVSSNLSGPRRVAAGAVRDHVLGIAGVGGNGIPFKAGGQVVKNVTGFDLTKLVCGAWGTLAALTRISVKTLPRPEDTRTVMLIGLADADAVRVMSEALGSPHEVSAAAHLPLDDGRPATVLRVEGPTPSVRHRAAALRETRAGRAEALLLDGPASRDVWASVRRVAPLKAQPGEIVWRLSVPPSAGSSVVAAIGRSLPLRALYDWGGGLIWLALPGESPDGGASEVRGAVAAVGGHATLFRAPEGLRSRVAVFHPQPEGLAALSRRLKLSLDPAAILNRGRLVEGL